MNKEKVICKYCKKKTPEDSVFCQNCGKRILKRQYTVKFSLPTTSLRALGAQIYKIKKYISFTVIIFLLLIGGSVYAAPKAIDYFQVQQLVADAEDLEQEVIITKLWMH